MNFTLLLERHAAQRPDAVAYYDVDQPLTYGDLLAESNRIAALLHAQGARPGDRLALWLPNCSTWLATFMACARLGVVVISMNTRFRSGEVGDLVSRGKCRWLVMWPSFKGLPFREILNDVAPGLLQGLQGIMEVGETVGPDLVPGIKLFNVSESAPADQLAHLPPASDTALALVYTTSGTTSQSKLVAHDQRTLIRHGENAARYFGIDRKGAVLMGAPFCGAFGFSSALAGLVAGAPLISAPVINAEECAAQIRRFGITHTFANNELLDMILKAGGEQDSPFPSLRVAGFASFAPSLDDLPDRVEQAGIRLVGLYGSSELQALAAGQSPDAPLAERSQPGGYLVAADGRVRARCIETGDVLPHGEVGEIEILSPSLMRGYLDNAEATAKAIDRDGYFRTGDLGHTTSNQHFVFHARRGDFLRLGGFLVNPLEIETFIEGLDGVANCQVVGVAHGGRTVPMAFVIAESGHALQEGELLAQCKARLAGFKVPKRIAIVDAFPVVESANSNKIQRGKLQEQALALLDAG